MVERPSMEQLDGYYVRAHLSRLVIQRGTCSWPSVVSWKISRQPTLETGATLLALGLGACAIPVIVVGYSILAIGLYNHKVTYGAGLSSSRPF